MPADFLSFGLRRRNAALAANRVLAPAFAYARLVSLAPWLHPGAETRLGAQNCFNRLSPDGEKPLKRLMRRPAQLHRAEATVLNGGAAQARCEMSGLGSSFKAVRRKSPA